MPANHKVSVAWQIAFTFLPVVNFWAFYRIRKLQKYLWYVIAPSILSSMFFYIYTYGPNFIMRPFKADPLLILIVSYVIGFAFTALEIYLVIIWSRQHNKQFDQPTTQAEQP